MALRWIKDDDVGYEKWIAEHLLGFVANVNRVPHARYFCIHRASHRLPDRSNPGSVNPRTGNNYTKVTADNLEELIHWAKENIPELKLTEVNFCKICDPRDALPVDSTPTADQAEYIQRAEQILARGIVNRPVGIMEPKRGTISVTEFYRDPKVRAWILQRAQGRCELCGSLSPFLTDSEEPYFESHHIVLMSKGGTDTPENTAALCPNCHREIHFGIDRDQLVGLLKQSIAQKESAYAVSS